MKHFSGRIAPLAFAFAFASLVAACGLRAAGLPADPEEEAPGQPDAGETRPPVTEDAGRPASPDGSPTDASPPLDAAPDAADGAVPPPPVVARLNIGGVNHVGIDLPGVWSASAVPGACGPSRYEASTALHGTRDAPLFVSEAFGNPLLCDVGTGLAPGRYRVTLHFAEIYFGPGCPGGGGDGSRVFQISLEGKEVAKDIDVFKESGGCLASTSSTMGAPIARTFEVQIDDGTLTISMKAKTNNAKVSAIEVVGPLP